MVNMMALFRSEWEFTTFCFYLPLIWWGDRLMLHSLGLILGYFQHHKVRTSSIVNQGFLEHKGAGNMEIWSFYRVPIQLQWVWCISPLKISRISLPGNVSLVTSSDCVQLLHCRCCFQWVTVQKFNLLNCFCSYFFLSYAMKHYVMPGDVFNSMPDE